MCTILKFALPPMSDEAEKGCGKPAKTGEIVIFPGVRYERRVDDLGPAHHGHQKRDFLVLR